MNELEKLRFDESIVERPAEIPAKRIMGMSKSMFERIAVGLLCSFIVSVIGGLPYIKRAAVWCCWLVLQITGNPDGSESVAQKLESTVAKAEASATPVAVEAPKPMERLKIAAESAQEKADEAVEKAKMAPIVAVKEKAAEKVEEVKETVTEGVDKVTDTLDGFRTGIGEKMEERREVALERFEAAERDSIIARAVQNGIEWQDRPLDEVRTEVIAAEAESRPNARCPSCSYQFRLPPHVTEGRYKCPRCKKHYSVPAARQLGSSPAPKSNPFGMGGFR